MPQLPLVMLRTQAPGPANNQQATDASFGGAGGQSLIDAQHRASIATRSAADSERAAAGATRQAGQAGLQADEALAGGVAAVGQAADKTSEVLYQHQAQQERSDLNAKLATMQADWAVKLNDTIQHADPGDTQVVPKFLDSFDSEASKVTDGLETSSAQQYATEAIARLRGHFFETAMLGQAQLTSLKAKQDYVEQQNKGTEALLTDPNGLGVALERHDSFLNYLVQNKRLDTASALKLGTDGRAELARAAVRGFINVDPKNATDRLNAGQFKQLLDADQTSSLLGEAKTEIRQRDQEQRIKRMEAREAANESKQAAFSQGVNLAIDGKLDLAGIKSLGVDGGQKVALMNLREVMANRATQLTDDPSTKMKVLDAMKDGSKTDVEKDQILNSALGHGINEDTWRSMKTVKSAMTADDKPFLDRIDEAARAKLIGKSAFAAGQSIALAGQGGGPNWDSYLKFNDWLPGEVARQKAKGKSIAEIAADDGPLMKALPGFASSGTTSAARAKMDALAASVTLRAPPLSQEESQARIKSFASGALDGLSSYVVSPIKWAAGASDGKPLAVQPRGAAPAVAQLGAAAGSAQVQDGETPEQYLARAASQPAKPLAPPVAISPAAKAVGDRYQQYLGDYEGAASRVVRFLGSAGYDDTSKPVFRSSASLDAFYQKTKDAFGALSQEDRTYWKSHGGLDAFYERNLDREVRRRRADGGGS